MHLQLMMGLSERNPVLSLGAASVFQNDGWWVSIFCKLFFLLSSSTLKTRQEAQGRIMVHRMQRCQILGS